MGGFGDLVCSVHDQLAVQRLAVHSGGSGCILHIRARVCPSVDDLFPIVQARPTLGPWQNGLMLKVIGLPWIESGAEQVPISCVITSSNVQNVECCLSRVYMAVLLVIGYTLLLSSATVALVSLVENRRVVTRVS